MKWKWNIFSSKEYDGSFSIDLKLFHLSNWSLVMYLSNEQLNIQVRKLPSHMSHMNLTGIGVASHVSMLTWIVTRHVIRKVDPQCFMFLSLCQDVSYWLVHYWHFHSVSQHTTAQQHNSGMLLLLFLQAALCHSHMCSALLWWHDKDATQNTLAVA